MENKSKRTGWYIHFNARDTVGASKKIDAQLKAFNRYFDVVEKDIKLKSRKRIANIFALLPLGSLTWNYTSLYKDEIPDFVYVRKILTDRKFYKFCKYVKKRRPDCKIIVEIHTWPYDRIKSKVLGDVFLFKDKYYNSKKTNKLVDRYVTYSDDNTIFGVQTIIVKNGTNVDAIKMRTPQRRDDKTINLIWVAFFGVQHGVERVIYGLKEYYANENKSNLEDVQLHMIGDGSVISQIKEMVKNYGLESKVHFYGYKYGDELDKLYDMCDIGLSIFGFYKAGVNRSSALKVREYLAKGLPVVSGCKEDAFDGVNSDYFLEYPNDDSIIDMTKVVEFYHRIYDNKSQECVVKEIREFAKKTVDMETAMKPVFDYCIE